MAHVDEYQDVSPLQHRLLTRWLGDNRNICVVGDPAQTIYSFAGASSYNLLNFASEFGPLTADVRLNNDYRSTPQIVNYANRVLEAHRNAPTISNSTPSETKAAESRKPSTTAISKKPGAWLHASADSWTREHLRATAPSSPESTRSRKSSAGHWANNICATASNETADGRTPRSRMTLRPAWPLVGKHRWQAGGDVKGVTISTIHASKGLEFKHVFLIGCSEGLIPYGSPPEGDLLEEERRLMYVAVTRAEDTLDVSYARAREDDGSDRGRRKSRFFR